MMKSIKSIALAVSGLFILPNVAHAKELSVQQTGLAMMRLQASLLSLPRNSQMPAGGSIWSRLRGDFRLDEVNADLVRSHEAKFANNRAYFNRTIHRSTPFMYHITQEVQKRNMPAEIALLPFIESAYVTKARSHVGASGLWQFMPATGRHYGLEQTPLYDGRHDVYAATDAALNYLQYLYGLFGDWSLALAAYNWGEGNVSRAIRRVQEQGMPPTYENLKMPEETRNYVPKLLAVRNLVNNPQAFGLKLPEIANSPYFQAVEVKNPMDIMAAAFLADIPQDEFLSLNPAFKTPVFIPKGKRRMLLPVAAVQKFERNYQDADSKTLLSWDVFTTQTNMDLNDLALKTGNSLNQIKSLNGLRSNTVPAGRTLLLNKNSLAALNQPVSGSLKDFAKLDFDPMQDRFVEQAPVFIGQPAYVANSAATLQNQAVVLSTPKVSTAEQGLVIANQALPNIDFVAKSQETLAAAEAKIAAEPVSQPMRETEALQSASTVAPRVNDVVMATEPSLGKQPTFAAMSSNTKPDNIERVQTAVNADAKVTVNSDDLMQWVQQTNERQQIVAATTREPLVKTAVQESAQQKARPVVKTREAVASQRSLPSAAAKEKDDAKANNKAKNTSTAAKNSTYKVGAGDTLYSIAKQHNMSVEDLMAVNGVKGNSIRAGQVLKVSVSGSLKNSKTETVAKHQGKKAQNLPVSYKVRKGDTLESIAARYNLKVNDLKKLNQGSTTIKPGQTLRF